MAFRIIERAEETLQIYFLGTLLWSCQPAEPCHQHQTVTATRGNLPPLCNAVIRKLPFPPEAADHVAPSAFRARKMDAHPATQSPINHLGLVPLLMLTEGETWLYKVQKQKQGSMAQASFLPFKSGVNDKPNLITSRSLAARVPCKCNFGILALQKEAGLDSCVKFQHVHNREHYHQFAS